MKDYIEIREARLTDCTFIYEFVCSLEGIEFDFSLFQNIFIENIENKHNVYLIASANNEPVGFLSCHCQPLLHHCSRIGEIQELYVDQAFRSRKIGQMLINQLELMAIQRGLACLEVASNKKRIQAHRFYLKTGFNESHFKFTKSII